MWSPSPCQSRYTLILSRATKQSVKIDAGHSNCRTSHTTHPCGSAYSYSSCDVSWFKQKGTTPSPNLHAASPAKTGSSLNNMVPPQQVYASSITCYSGDSLLFVLFRFSFHFYHVCLPATGACQRIHRHVLVAGASSTDADAILRHASRGMTACRAKQWLKSTQYMPLTCLSSRIALHQLCLAACLFSL